MFNGFGRYNYFGRFGGPQKRSSGGGGGELPAALLSIDADGRTAIWNGTPPFAKVSLENGSRLYSFTVTRKGPSDTGTQIQTLLETVYVTAREIADPNQTTGVNQSQVTGPDLVAQGFTFHPNRVFLSTEIYAGDIVDGGAVTNNSTLQSPKPVGAWVDPDRRVWNSAVQSFGTIWAHRDTRQGRLIRTMRYRANRNGQTDFVYSAWITAPALSTDPANVVQFPEWRGTLDISTLPGLTDGDMIVVNCEAYGWTGDIALSKRDSTDETARFRLSPQYFRYDTRAPNIYVVSDVGNDGTGAPSTDPATARLTPYLTTAAACLAMSGSNADGFDRCELWIAGPVTWGAFATNRVMKISGLLVKRDPNVARSAAILTYTGGAMGRTAAAGLTAPLVQAQSTFQDLDITVTGAWSAATTATELNLINCNINDTGGGAGTYQGTNCASIQYWGGTYSNVFGSHLIGNGVGGPQTYRGINFTASRTNTGICGYLVAGCRFDKLGNINYNTSTQDHDGSILWHTLFNAINTGGGVFASSGGQNTTRGMVIVNSVIEVIDQATPSTPGTSYAISNDGQTGDIYNYLRINTIEPGCNRIGFQNINYDDRNATPKATFTAVITAGSMNVTVFSSGAPLVVGDVIPRTGSLTGFTSELTITALGTGTGGVGTYTVSPAVTLSSRAFKTAPAVDNGKRNHTLLTVKGSIIGRSATKGRRFMSGEVDTNITQAQVAGRRGNISWEYMVGSSHNVVTWLSQFQRMHYGMFSAYPDTGTNDDAAPVGGNLPQGTCEDYETQYTDWKGGFVTAGLRVSAPLGVNMSGGTGNGTYSLRKDLGAGNHPGVNRCGANLFTSHDVTGAVRDASNNSAGAYR
jgi:hypothetical protein